MRTLEQSIPLKDREQWIDDNCQDVDVVISHPRLVETGLDLFSKSYLGHNFCTRVFYETGYELPVMRQASRRAWRLQQPKECKVFYMFYEGTMQEKAMEEILFLPAVEQGKDRVTERQVRKAVAGLIWRCQRDCWGAAVEERLGPSVRRSM